MLSSGLLKYLSLFILLLLCAVAVVPIIVVVEAFTTTTTINNNIHPSSITASSSSRQSQFQSHQFQLHQFQFQLNALPNGYKEFGERIIREAALECGMVLEDDTDTDEADADADASGTEISTDEEGSTSTSTSIIKKNKLDIEWKAGSIIVTVHGDVLLSAIPIEEIEEAEDGNDNDDEDTDNNVDDETTADLFDDDDAVDDEDEVEEKEIVETVDENARGAIDLALLARTINRMLDPPKVYGDDDDSVENEENIDDDDDDGSDNVVSIQKSIGLAIAEVHSIEVTTPGVSDDLLVLVKTNPSILNVYKGFEIKIEQKDLKTVKKAKTKQKIIEGRLVEYNKEFTIININGRMKTIRNDTIISMKLPKAKKEKGTR
jgi:hypothetical protein